MELKYTCAYSHFVGKPLNSDDIILRCSAENEVRFSAFSDFLDSYPKRMCGTLATGSLSITTFWHNLPVRKKKQLFSSVSS
jgi:hypothetical protein